MNYLDEINNFFGFSNDELVEKLLKVNLSIFTDEINCKIGTLAAMSKNEEHHKFAQKILSKLVDKHERDSPYLILKWLIQIQKGKMDLGEIIQEWSQRYPDNLSYSRINLWAKQLTDDPIKIIGNYCQHLEIFWNDHLGWFKLGELYLNEKNFNKASFCFEEAISLDPENSKYYYFAGKARLEILENSEINQNIAKKFLSKAILIDQNNNEAISLLIKIPGQNQELFKTYFTK